MSHLDNFLKFYFKIFTYSYFYSKKIILKNKGPFKKGPSIWAREDGLRTWKKIKKRA